MISKGDCPPIKASLGLQNEFLALVDALRSYIRVSLTKMRLLRWLKRIKISISALEAKT